MTFVDTARSNTGAIKFFKRMGYGKPEAEVWMSKLIQRTRKSTNSQRSPTPVARRPHAKLRQKIAKPAVTARRFVAQHSRGQVGAKS